MPHIMIEGEYHEVSEDVKELIEGMGNIQDTLVNMCEEMLDTIESSKYTTWDGKYKIKQWKETMKLLGFPGYAE